MISNDLADASRQWLKAVDALQAQNNDLKEEFSLILRRQQLSAVLLRQLDSFHTQLLNIDAALALLRHDVAVQVRNNYNGILVTAGPMPHKLGRDIGAMEANMADMGRQLESLKEEAGKPEQYG